MGCECSDPRKKGEDPLLAEAKTKGKQNTQPPSNQSLAECEENGINESLTERKEKPSKSNQKWYIESEHKTNANILETLSSIIGHSYKNDIQNAIKNVKVKQNLNEVCQYLLYKANSTQNKPDLQGKHDCKESIDDCSSMTRIITVFEAYIKWINSAKSGETKESLYAIVEDKLPKQINIQQIINDYHHFIINHNTDKEFESVYDTLLQKNLIISIDKSSIILRNYRDRSIAVKKERERLYFGYNDTNEVVLIKLIDRIYCFFVYSFDIGMRFRMKQKLKILYADKDKKLVCMKTLVKKKQINLINIIGTNRIKIHKFASKYNEKEAAVFYYKPDKAKSEEKINVFGAEYTQKDWFIKPKYESLKDELIHNNECRISKKEFDDLIALATLHSKSEYNIRSKTMDEHHMLALMVYCNYPLVQSVLKQSYFRLNEEESDFQLKKRHSLLAHLGGLLQEVVVKYGIECNETNVLYHSMELKAINGTLIKYISPTSTSSSQLVVLNYSLIAQNGTMIELNGNAMSKYFDCSFISDFGNECEHLFVSDSNPLELLCIFDLNNLKSYTLYVSVLSIICIAFGQVNEHWNEDKTNPFKERKDLKKLSKQILEERAIECQPHLFGNKKKKKKKKNKDENAVLSEMLAQFALSQKEMYLFWFSSKTVEVWPWIDELLGFMTESCFCKELNNKTKWVKLDLLSLFFKSMESVIIVDYSISEDVLNDIDLFIKKLKNDPSRKYKKEPAQIQRLESDALDIDIGGLVDQLYSEKSHISFNDPTFDDLCDYRQCKIKEIKILESYDESKQANSILNQDKMMRKFNKRYKKSGWKVVKAKIMGNNDGFSFQKI